MPDNASAGASYPRDVTIPEPGDRAIVAWFAGGVPMKVYARIDEFASERQPLDRWFDADEDRGAREGALSWLDLQVTFAGRRDWHGPYLLNVGELLGGEQR